MNQLALPDVALAPFLPILLPLLGAIVATLGFHLPRRTATLFGAATLVLSGVTMIPLWNDGVTTIAGALRADNFALGFGMIIVIGALIALLVTLDHAPRAGLNFPEFDAMLLYSVTGMLLIAFSGDLVVMLIGLEIMSIAGYILVSLYGSRASEESGIKYFLLGAVGSATLIYGMALTFGATGQLSYVGISAAIETGIANPALLVAGAILMIAGFGFKVALAPFHQWTPDVYGGAPTSITLFLSTVVKVGAFVAFARVFGFALPVDAVYTNVLAVLIAATLIIANIGAALQTNVKRLLAYSAVAHTGFLGLALLAEPELGVPALMYYLLAYTLMTAGAVAIVAVVQRSERGVELEELRGLYHRRPALALAFTAFLVSLAGIPPFAGFMGKLLVFQAAYLNGHVAVVIIAALTSVIALVYYLRVAAVMFAPAIGVSALPDRPAAWSRAMITVCVIGIVVLGVVPGLAYGLFAGEGAWLVAAVK